MADWHESYRREIEYCTYCPKLCRFSCPVAQVECSETVTPTGKMTVLKLVRDGVLPFNEEVGELVYLCTGCLISRTYCEHDIEVYPPFESARIEAINQGVAPPVMQKFAQNWEQKRNPFNKDFSETLKSCAPEEYLQKDVDVVLFTGCTALHYFPEQISDTVRVLQALDLDFRLLDQESLCCGYPLITAGHRGPFLEQARQVAEGLNRSSLVITPCPTCTHTIKERYPELGIEIKPEVMHISRFLADNLDRLPLRAKEENKVIYHDPCHLGRYLGIYDEPRKVLEAATGEPPLEFFENREAATCCGSGGGLPLVRPGTARGIAREKMQTVPEYGAGVLATSCPMCRRALDRAGKDLNIRTEDIITILARQMEPAGK
ncbi:MAG: (Fe-S)-binding protein [bacterium]